MAGTSASRLRLSPPDLSHEPQAVDAGLGLVHRVLADDERRLRAARRAPATPAPGTNASFYRDFFGAPVRFDAQDALLRVPTRLFAQPMALPVHRELQQLVLAYLQSAYVDPRNRHGRCRPRRGRPWAGHRPGTHGGLRRVAAPAPPHAAAPPGRRGDDLRGCSSTHARSAPPRYRLLTQTDVPDDAGRAHWSTSPVRRRSPAPVRRWFGRTPSQLRRDAAGRPCALSPRDKHLSRREKHCRTPVGHRRRVTTTAPTDDAAEATARPRRRPRRRRRHRGHRRGATGCRRAARTAPTSCWRPEVRPRRHLGRVPLPRRPVRLGHLHPELPVRTRGRAPTRSPTAPDILAYLQRTAPSSASTATSATGPGCSPPTGAARTRCGP